MGTESLKRGFIPFLFALALLMAFVPAPIYPQVGYWWQVEVIVDNTVYHHHPPPSEGAQVVQGGIFIIRHISSWTDPEYSGSYSISISWDCYENHPYENFTFLYTQAYFTTGDNAGEAIENSVTFQAQPVGAHTRYAVSVSNIADDREGQFNVDVVMRASGAGGVPHIPTSDNAPAIITYGPLGVTESAIHFDEVDPITIEVLPPPNQPPRADFNFSPERPIVGEKVYFFDNSEDLDGYIVEWYWSYSLHFGDNYWMLPMPFGNGEQNPTLTFYHAGEASITLGVADDDGAIDRVSRIIQILAPVQVLISPTYQEGVPGATLTYSVTVSNTGDVYDNYDLAVSDNENWGPTLSENLLENVGPGENRVVTLSVTIPENATSFTEDNIRVTATSAENVEVSGSDWCIARVQGKAEFDHVTLYKASLDVDLYLGSGSKLVVKFYTWGSSYQGENVVWTGSTPDNVSFFKYLPHPLGRVGVQIVKLDLTYDTTENVIQTIASYTVRKIDIEKNFMIIPFYWSMAQTPEERLELEMEFMEKPFYWSAAPS